MKWSILIVTIPRRREKLKELLNLLKPQLIPYLDVEVVAKEREHSLSLGQFRHRMIEHSKAQYVSFIDDDDLVAEDYVSQIYPKLDGVDQVGFKLHYYQDGHLQCMVYHDLRAGGWHGHPNLALYRDFSRFNVIRRDLLLQLTEHSTVDANEDGDFANSLRKLDIVKTQHFVPEVMYFYLCNNQDSIQKVRA